MTTIYLATIPGSQSTVPLLSYRDQKEKPAILISFAYLPGLRSILDQLKGYRLMLDSGAFTAHTKGKQVDLVALTQEAKTGRWKEVAALDVIGNPEASLKNALLMKEQGVNVMPTFHYGEPWEFLATMAAKFDKVALGGLVPVKSPIDKRAWIEECFARAYPKKFHCFGWIHEETLLQYPFHSADSSGWYGAVRFGHWGFAGGQKLGLNRPKAKAVCGDMYLKPEIELVLRLQKKVQARWRQEFSKQGWN